MGRLNIWEFGGIVAMVCASCGFQVVVFGVSIFVAEYQCGDVVWVFFG